MAGMVTAAMIRRSRGDPPDLALQIFRPLMGRSCIRGWTAGAFLLVIGV